MITDNRTHLAATPFTGAATPLPGDPIGLLIRVYRQAGLSTETARRCAVADFLCCFPEYVTTGVSSTRRSHDEPGCIYSQESTAGL